MPVSEQRLATSWLIAPDRNAVTRAAHRLDQRLRTDPLHLGESRRSSVVRFAYDYPLGIEYEVIEDAKNVRVLSVWTIDKQS